MAEDPAKLFSGGTKAAPMRREPMPVLHEERITSALIGFYVDDLIFAGVEPLRKISNLFASRFPRNAITEPTLVYGV